MGIPELIRDIHNGVEPDSVIATIAFTSLVWFAMYIADIAMASSTRSNVHSTRCLEVRMLGCCSVSLQTLSIASTAATGCFPLAVSADNIIASVPSSTAFATSNTSARVGIGFSIIDSIICVAVITARSKARERWIKRFWTAGKFASPISTPKSPRATITTSEARIISSIVGCNTASARSTLETILA